MPDIVLTREGVLEFWSKTPFGVRSILTLCTATLLYTELEGSSEDFLICHYPIVRHGEVWRVLTSNFGHMNILHYLMNMFSLIGLGHFLETCFGTFSFSGLVLFFGVNISLMYLLFVEAAYLMEDDSGWLTYCSVGFSGVLFALLVLLTEIRSGEQWSLFGIIEVHSRLYPFLLAILLQIVLPDVSVVGHGAGIAAGHLYCRGYLDSFMLSFNQTKLLEAAILSNLKERCGIDLSAYTAYRTRNRDSAAAAFFAAQERRETENGGVITELAARFGFQGPVLSILPYADTDYAAVPREEAPVPEITAADPGAAIEAMSADNGGQGLGSERKKDNDA